MTTMREILFRGRRMEIGDWVEGCLISYPDGECFIGRPSGDPNVLDKFCVYSDTVGQYSGLRDRNGRRIFEGDILRIEEELWSNGEVVEIKEYVCEVFFDKRDARFSGKGTRHREWLYNWGAKYREVIGNIYENPERLGGADV